MRPHWLLSTGSSALLVFVARSAAQSCYYPDGSFPSDYAYVPCTGDSVSSCCIPSEGDVCLSSGLCYYQSGKYPFRGACTDKSWSDDKCPKYCLDERRTGWQGMVKCNTNRYCCSQSQSNLTCCNDNKLVFSIDVSPSAYVNDYTSITAPNAPKTTPSAAATIKPSSRPFDGTATTTSSSSTSTSSSSSSSSSSGGRTVAIAVGVAVPVAIIAAALVAWACFERRRRRRAEATSATVPKPQIPQSPMLDNGQQQPLMQQQGGYGGAPPYAPYAASPQMPVAGGGYADQGGYMHQDSGAGAVYSGGPVMQKAQPQQTQTPIAEMAASPSTAPKQPAPGVPVHEAPA